MTALERGPLANTKSLDRFPHSPLFFGPAGAFFSKRGFFILPPLPLAAGTVWWRRRRFVAHRNRLWRCMVECHCYRLPGLSQRVAHSGLGLAPCPLCRSLWVGNL